MFGLYRRTFGSRIVESSYDYATSIIGPYKLPIVIHEPEIISQGVAVSVYNFYQLLNKYEDALAVFNNNNYCYCIVFKDRLEMMPFSPNNVKRGDTFPTLHFENNLPVPTYKHVGWVKTYQSCIATYTWPWKLILDEATGEVWDFSDKIEGAPLENPPLSLYKCLIDTNHRGVYFDTKLNKPVFID